MAATFFYDAMHPVPKTEQKPGKDPKRQVEIYRFGGELFYVRQKLGFLARPTSRIVFETHIHQQADETLPRTLWPVRRSIFLPSRQLVRQNGGPFPTAIAA